MFEVLGLIFPLFGLILLGYLGGRLFNHPLAAMTWLNTFIVYFALPALFFKLLSTTPINELASWDFVLVNISITIFVVAITMCIGLITTKGNIAESGIQGLAGAYGNIGYMGPPIAILAFGEKAAVPVAIIFCFENVLHFMFAPAIMAVAGEEKKSVIRLIAEVSRKILLHPFIVATIVGIIAASIKFVPPVPLGRLIDYLANAAAPCALFAMGLTMALRPLKRVPWSLGYIVPMKLVMHPLLMYIGLSWAGNFDPIWMYCAILLAALPIATNVYVIAEQYGVWMERASAAVMLSTLFSVLTVSAVLYAITSGALPHDLFP